MTCSLLVNSDDRQRQESIPIDVLILRKNLQMNLQIAMPK